MQGNPIGGVRNVSNVNSELSDLIWYSDGVLVMRANQGVDKRF